MTMNVIALSIKVTIVMALSNRSHEIDSNTYSAYMTSNDLEQFFILNEQ